MITMPTRKPDVVNEHRITIGRWEREQVKALNEAKIVKDVGVGVGVAAVGIGGTFVAYKIGKSIYDWVEGGVGDEILKFFGVPDDLADTIEEEDVLSTNNPNPVFRVFWKTLGL